MANYLSHKARNHKLLQTVEQTVSTCQMFQPGDSVLVGVSGGPDSVALLYMLLSLSPGFSIRLGVAHLNHCLRGEDSDNDAEFVASLARELGLPYYIRKEDVQKYRNTHKLSLEEAARQVRYAFYENMAEKNGFNKIALGHHADDNAESVLMYLLRGSGPRGISGIPPVREGKFVRPLICLTKSEIIDFLESDRLKYVSDLTNRDTKHLRNRIRHHLLPMLKASYNPKITETLNRMASILRTEEEWIEEVINPVFKSCVSAVENKKIALSVSAMYRLHVAAQKRIVRKTIAQVKGNLRRITYTHTDAVLNLLQKGTDCASLDLPDHIRVKRDRGMLLFSGAESSDAGCGNFEYSILAPGTIFIEETGDYLEFSRIGREDMPCFKSGDPGRFSFQSSDQAVFFDMDTLSFPIIIRNFRPGDRFTPLGMSGTQKVKKYFINNKVPGKERVKCPILLCQGKIVWIAGHRMDESVKVTPSTRNVLKAELLKVRVES